MLYVDTLHPKITAESSITTHFQTTTPCPSISKHHKRKIMYLWLHENPTQRCEIWCRRWECCRTLTVDNAASPNSLSPFLSDTTAGVFLFDSLQQCVKQTRTSNTTKYQERKVNNVARQGRRKRSILRILALLNPLSLQCVRLELKVTTKGSENGSLV